MKLGINANEANVTSRVGSNRYAFEMLKTLKTQMSSKDQVKVFLKSSVLADLPKSSKSWQYQVFGPKKLWTQLGLPLNLYLKNQDLDAFYTPGHYAPRWCPVPSVVSILDLAYLYYPQSFLKKDLVQLKNWTKYSVKKADHIITISQSTKKDVVNQYQVSPKKVSVVYPGLIKLSGPKLKTQKVLKKYKFSQDYLLYVGTLQPRKNLKRLIKAFSGLKNYTGQLVVVGKKGWMWQDTFELVKKLNLINRVVFTGYVTDSELRYLFQNTQLYINPSLYEGFGFPVLQAMNLRAPVLVSNVSSLPEVVGDTGEYIQDPKSIESIKKGIIKALQVGKSKTKKAQLRAKRFSWAKTGRQTLKILKKVGQR